MFVQHVRHFPLELQPTQVAWINLARHPIFMTQSWWYYMIDPTVRPLGRAEATLETRKKNVCGCAKLTFGECVLTAPQRNCERENLRSEEHTSELQSLMRISYAVFCLK